MYLEITGSYQKNIFGLWSITHQVEIMSVIFLVFVLIFLISLKDIVKPFRKLKRHTCIILLFLIILGFLLRNTEYVYGSGYDGLFYLTTAKLMFEKDIQAHNCAIGNLDKCYLYNQHLAPAGYPFLIVLSFLIFGVHDINAMLISSILGTLNILLVFLICYLLFRNEKIGLYSSLVFALIPFDILLSSTGAVRTTSIFFSGLAFLLFLISLKSDKTRLWSLTAITFSYSIYVRQENFLLIFPMFLLFVFTKKIGLKSLGNLRISFIKKYSIPLFIFLVSQIPVQHWIIYADHGPKLFVFENFFLLAYSILKIIFFDPNLGKTYYSIIASSAFVLSATLFLNRKTRNRITLAVLWVWFLSYFIIYSLYFQCSNFPKIFCYEYIRFVQGLNFPYAILSGVFIFSLERFLRKKIRAIFPLIVALLLISAIVLPNSIYTIKTNFFKDARIEEVYIGDTIRAMKQTPGNAIVFTEQASVHHLDYFKGDDRIILDTNIFTFNNYNYTLSALSNNKGRPIYIIRSVDCPYPDINMCKFIYDNFELSKIGKFGSVTLNRMQGKNDYINKIIKYETT